MSANSVRKYVKELTEKCLIHTEPRKTQMKNGRRRNSSLRYTILPIDITVDHFHAEQMAELEFQNCQAEAAAKAKSIATNNPGSQFRFTPATAAPL